MEESHKLDDDANLLGQEEPLRLVEDVPQETEHLRERDSFEQEGAKRAPYDEGQPTEAGGRDANDVLLAKLLEEDSLNEVLEKRQG